MLRAFWLSVALAPAPPLASTLREFATPFARAWSSAASLARALQAVVETARAPANATRSRISRSLGLTVPFEAAVVPLQVLTDNHSG